ncbi:MAG: SDR family NAD(P)-dependent oxidoreductase [Pseudomonadota bacterium]
MNSIIISGAAGGIGRETVVALSALDRQLVCVDIDEQRLLDSISDIDNQKAVITPIVSSLRDADSCRSTISACDHPLQGVVHLAGVFEKDLDYSRDTYNRAIQENLTNGYELAALAIPHMKNVQGASMVFVSSLSFMRGAKNYVAYSAAKGGLVGMTRALSRRLSPEIRVNAIAPGIIDTPMPAELIAERGAAVTHEIPLGRLGQPHEIASVVRFLLSSDASYITGQVINVDGGVTNT